MHPVHLSDFIDPFRGDWWSLELVELEKLTTLLIGPFPGGWVRRGKNFIRIGDLKYGADAEHMEKEFEILTEEVGRVLTEGAEVSAIRAAAYFHLRFEHIHPLCEANGRIGRVILAHQIQQSFSIPAREILEGLQDAEADYQGVFRGNKPELMFELLVHLLARLTGVLLPPEATTLPGKLEPRYPQKGTPKNVARVHPEKVLANPELAKQRDRQLQQARSQQHFRKFR